MFNDLIELGKLIGGKEFLGIIIGGFLVGLFIYLFSKYQNFLDKKHMKEEKEREREIKIKEAREYRLGTAKRVKSKLSKIGRNVKGYYSARGKGVRKMEEIRIILDNNRPDYFYNHMDCEVYLKVVVKRKNSEETIKKIKEFLDKELNIIPKG